VSARPFDTIVVVGVGLIGGSFAAAVRRLPDPPRVLGVEPDSDARLLAVKGGIVDEALDADAAVEAGWFSLDAGRETLVLLATPVKAVEAWLERLGALGFAGVVSDAASSKAGVFAAAGMLSPKAEFIGGHPMAGSERSGVTAANPDLFRDAYYVLTPSETSDADAYRRLHALVSSLGARVIAVAPALHDEAVAVISHVPHVAASALTNLAAERAGDGREVLRLAAGGFKDMTRIAAGSPELWTGILSDNATAVSRAIGELVEQLQELRGSLDAGDSESMRSWLSRAAEVRRSLPAKWVPATAALSVLSIPMTDRPGMVGTITQAAAHAGCNIEDIEIEHQSEDTALLRLVLTDEGDFEGLLAELAREGFETDLRPL
jgi:prephenate dehydrogenase